MVTGSCLCGVIRYEVEGELGAIQLCHCRECRKAQGTPFGSNLPVAATAFRISSGEELLADFESSPGKHRLFCSRCGSPIISRRDNDPHTVRIRAGTLDDPVDTRPARHIFVSDKASWWAIHDDLPQDQTWPTAP